MRPMPLHVSYANRPSHLYIRSDDAIDLRTTGSPSNFQLPLVENILDARAAQLLQAQIPLVIPQIPNYQRFFVYIVPNVLGFGGIEYRAFMLDHSTAQESYLYYADYQALVTQLNIDAGFYLSYVPTSATSSPNWTYPQFALAPGQSPDVSFTYQASTRQITMTNLRTIPLTLANESQVQPLFLSGIIRKAYLYLNFLLGFDTLASQITPIPSGATYIPPSFAKLQPTQTIYVRANFVMNGSQDSSQIKNTLAAIPVNVPTLALVEYVSTQRHYTFAVPPTIGAIEIALYDDNNQPLDLPENAQTCFDIGFVYDE